MDKHKRLLSVLVVVAVLAPVGALTASAQGAELTNASFERGYVAWESWGEGDLREEYYGLSPEDGENFLRLWKRSGWYQDFPVVQDETFRVSVFVATAEKDRLRGDAFGEIKIEWRDKRNDGDAETGQPISLKFDTEGNQDKTISPDRWRKLTLDEAVAPANATHARVLCTIWSSGGDEGGGCALFDKITLE